MVVAATRFSGLSRIDNEERPTGHSDDWRDGGREWEMNRQADKML